MTPKIGTNLIKKFRLKKPKSEEVNEDSRIVSQQTAGESASRAGFGKATGELVDLKKKLTKDVLDKEMSGKILVTEGLDSAEAVFCANALGVAGIVLDRKLTDEEKKIRDKVAGKVSLAFLAKEGLDFEKMVGKKADLDGEKGRLNT